MKKITILFVFIGIVIGFQFVSPASSKTASYKYHTAAQVEAYLDTLRMAPIAAGEYFLPSSSCRGCHGYDSAHTSSIDEAGNDVNLVDRWESSMMAMSAKDPFWKAKVTQEIMINPAHANELQNRCLDCHSPLGAYTAKFHGHPYYTLADLATDSLGQDGVSCGACHTISPNGLGLGSFFSGNIPFDTTHVEYGPFPSPFEGAMQLYEGFTPVYSTHMDQGRLCSACHTLITQSVDLSGAYTGGYFVEQATYHEYVNSIYPGNDVKCQTCHMPQITDAVVLSSSTSGLTPRTPFNQHKFQGANYFMLNLIKNNRDSLDVSVPEDKFDSTIVATADQLRHKSIDMNILLDSVTADTAYFKVKILNKAGHKFPSGYPSRRAILQLVITNGADTLFRSGTFDDQLHVVGENAAFEPHHNVITQSDMPQIYEEVPGDVNGNFTPVLERAAMLLKDNRIPPAGFTTSSPVYDTTLVSADANADGDFNKTGAVEGSGSDYVHFRAPVTGWTGSLKIRAKVYYQAAPPKWVDPLFTLSAPAINRFKTMYDNADKNPFLMVSDSLDNVGLSSGINNAAMKTDIRVWPTLTRDGHITVASEYGELIKLIDVYTTDGKHPVQIANISYLQEVPVDLPAASGIYYIRVQTNKKIYYKKVVKS